VKAWRSWTNTPGGSELSDTEEVAAGEWLRSLSAEAGLEVLAFGLGGESGRRLAFGFFADLSRKISWFQQRSCAVCPEEPPDAPWFDSPLRIKPESRQLVTGAYLQDLRERLLAAAGDRYLALYDRDLCIAMTFVLSASRSKRLDVDNLAKVMCDGLRGTVYNDDAQIQHLDVMKVRMTEDAEEWVHLRVRPTAVASHLDVFDLKTHHKFGVMKI